jgi:hypothetical protein
MAVWEITCCQLRDFFLSQPLSSIPCRISKSITPCDHSFGEQLLGYLQEGLSNVENESECEI